MNVLFELLITYLF